MDILEARGDGVGKMASAAVDRLGDAGDTLVDGSDSLRRALVERGGQLAKTGIEQVNRLCRAIAWAGGNEKTATRLAEMSVEESGMGSPEPKRRAKVQGVLRDALRQKSMGVIEEIPEKGIVKYAKPAGVIASLIPVTSPYITPIGIAIYAIKCKDAVIFSPHPGSRKTTTETVRVMRAALKRLGVPEELASMVVECLTNSYMNAEVIRVDGGIRMPPK